MLRALLAVTALAICRCVNADYDPQAQKASMGGSLVIPQVIPSFEPRGYMHVIYDGIDVGGAQQFAAERLVAQPLIGFNVTKGAPAGPPYLLLMIDPDASAIHTSQSCALHWMLSDVYFDSETNMLQSGFISARYSRPNPPEGPLHHRYVFLLFEQPVLFLPPVFPRTLTGSRLHFNLQAFLTDFGLREAVGGNFIRAFWTGVDVTAEEEQAQAQQAKIATFKAHANPWIAGLIGSVLGLLYGASR